MDKLRIRQAVVVEGKYDQNALRQLVDTAIFTTNGFTGMKDPALLRLLRQERAELEGNYYGLRGLACDGMPRGSSPGKPTEESGLRALENGVSERLAEIAETERVLSEDEACIRACLDALNGKYKEVIVMRYVRGYSWAKISARLGTADSTARNWHTRAMERLGEVLEELPEAEALARRASRART